MAGRTPPAHGFGEVNRLIVIRLQTSDSSADLVHCHTDEEMFTELLHTLCIQPSISGPTDESESTYGLVTHRRNVFLKDSHPHFIVKLGMLGGVSRCNSGGNASPVAPSDDRHAMRRDVPPGTV